MVGIGFFLLFGESDVVQLYGFVGVCWKWDGILDDGGDFYGEGIFNE